MSMTSLSASFTTATPTQSQTVIARRLPPEALAQRETQVVQPLHAALNAVPQIQELDQVSGNASLREKLVYFVTRIVQGTGDRADLEMSARSLLDVVFGEKPPVRPEDPTGC